MRLQWCRNRRVGWVLHFHMSIDVIYHLQWGHDQAWYTYIIRQWLTEVYSAGWGSFYSIPPFPSWTSSSLCCCKRPTALFQPAAVLFYDRWLWYVWINVHVPFFPAVMTFSDLLQITHITFQCLIKISDAKWMMWYNNVYQCIQCIGAASFNQVTDSFSHFLYTAFGSGP